MFAKYTAPFEEFFKYWKLFALKYKKSLIVLFIMTISVSFLDVFFYAYMLKTLIDLISSAEPSADILRSLIILITIFILSHALEQFLYRVRNYKVDILLANLGKDVIDYSYNKIIQKNYGFFIENNGGTIHAQLSRFKGSIVSFTYIIESFFFSAILTALITLTGVTIFVPIAGLVFLIWCVLTVILVLHFFKKRHVIFEIAAESGTKLVGGFMDSLINILNVKIFAKSKNEEKFVRRLTEDKRRKRIDVIRNEFLFHSLLTALMVSSFTIVTIVLFQQWYVGEITVGTIVFVYTSFGFMFHFVFSQLPRTFNRIVDANAQSQEFIRLLKSQKKEMTSVKNKLPVAESCDLEFKDVSFKYENSGEKVFNNLNVKIKECETLAIIGHSGAGKSTFVNLMLKLFKPDEGNIFLGGKDIGKFNDESVRNYISYVPQDIFLFNRSFRDNIKYGGSKMTDKEVLSVARKAQIYEVISKSQDGLDTIVGDRGLKLSVGERQRVAIARAIASDRPIIILDEATSSVDNISENLIQKAMNELTKNKTTIIIAHRLSTIKNVDRILVFDKGEIVESGTHEELIKKKKHYFQFIISGSSF